ncbi:MAG: hypothetical protein RIC55_16770 [Pirellulaceae bacterium]
MAIVVACRCGKRYAVPDSLVGSEPKCPACGAKIPVVASPDCVDVEDWLLDGLSEKELTSIADLTRSGAAMDSAPATRARLQWRCLLDWPTAAARYVVGTRLGRLGLAIALLVIIPSIALTAWHWRGVNRLAAEKATIANSGEPISLRELSDAYRVAEGEDDASQQWMGAVRSLAGPQYDPSTTGLPIVDFAETDQAILIPPPPERWIELRKAEQLLHGFHNELAELKAVAGAEGEVRYPLEFETGSDANQIHSLLMRGARLLSLEAHVRAHQGASDGTADSIHAVLALAASLDDQPSLRAHRDMIDCSRMGCERIRQLLGHVEFSPQQLQRLRDDLRAADFQTSLYAALVGERVRGMAALESSSSLAASETKATWVQSLGASHEDTTFYLVCMNRAVRAAQEPLSEAIDVAWAIDEDLENHVDNSAFGRRRFGGSLELVPLMYETFHDAAEAIALNRCADAAIAAELYRQQKGRLPQRLGELTPDYFRTVPTDPRTEQPLYCGRSEEGFFVAGGRRDEEADADEDAPALVFLVPGLATAP